MGLPLNVAAWNRHLVSIGLGSGLLSYGYDEFPLFLLLVIKLDFSEIETN
jgi:hypothetical protein